MDYKTFLDSIKERSKFKTWGGKTQLPSTRFHHSLSPVVTFAGGFRIVSASRDYDEPTLDSQFWELSRGDSNDVVCVIDLFEYPSINQTHEAMIETLASLTAPRLDYNPKRRSPGDIIILSYMARDNLLISLGLVQSMDESTCTDLFRQIDDWLLGNWPLMVSKKRSQNAVSLNVEMRAKNQSVRIGESVELIVEVRKNDTVLDLKNLPHRFLANPGRIYWENNIYFFRSDRPGMSEITLDIMGPRGEYGRSSITLQVIKR